MYIAAPAVNNAAPAMNYAGEFTRARTWCIHEGAAGNLRK